jgi:N-acetyl-D-muramate 6-phosphate phosphatase
VPQALKARAVLFDLDGTLVDTAPDLGAAANRVRAELGLEPLPLERYRPVASAGARGLLGVALDLKPDHPDFPVRRDSFIAHYASRIALDSRLFAGIDAALAHYESRRTPWGIVTNKPQWLTDRLLDELRLTRRAAVILGQSETVKPKPAPDGLLRAAEMLRLQPSDCVYVGDDQRDITAARAAGMPVVAVGWGYVGYGAPIESWGADAILQSPDELKALCQ